MSYIPSPPPAWANTWTGITPGLSVAPATSPLLGGLASLPGAQGGVLSRGLPPTSPLASLGQQATRASLPQFGNGVASNLLAESNALGGGGGIASRATGLFANPNLTRAAAFKGLGYGLAGAAGSGLIDQLNIGGQNSNVEQALQGAAQGAGFGAGIGSVFPGIGTAVGAGVGAVAGGALGVLGNLFGGGGGEDDKAPDPVNILANAINTAQLDPTTTSNILDTYEVMMALAGAEEDDDLRAQREAAAYEQAGQMILAAMQQREQMSNTASNTLALQAQASDLFAPLASDIETSGALYADAMRGIRERLPESYQPIADATVARELSASQRLANAYRAQAATLPAVNQLAQYQQDFNSFAAQQFQQAQQAALQQMMGGGTGGQTDPTALLPTP